MGEDRKEIVLFSWLGTGDVRNTSKKGKLSGALFDAIQMKSPDRVFLLNGLDYKKQGSSQEEVEGYLKELESTLGTKLQVKRIEGFNPIDYREICSHVIPFLEKHYEQGAETFFLQTSGTPSTAVVWILLSQTSFPASLLQTSAQTGAEVVNLPFRVVADFIPSNRDRKILGLVAGDEGDSDIIYHCDAMKQVLAKVDRVALHDFPIILLGESGTGKELFAKRIHEKSKQSSGNLIAVNCGAIPENLAESELFGHKKGAFTGASTDKKGVFEQAKGGTLFLDEIGELPLNLQVKLLRALQEKVVIPVGGTEQDKIEVDVRIIAATHRDLQKDIANRKFREDLFYRLAVGVVQIPPLRDRDDDVLRIAEHMLDEINKGMAKEVDHYKRKQLGKCAKKVVENYWWPGNVRELRSTLCRICLWTDHAVISGKDVEKHLIQAPNGTNDYDIMQRPLGKGLDVKALQAELRDHYIKRAAEATGGCVVKMVELIGLSSPTIHKNWSKKNDPKL